MGHRLHVNNKQVDHTNTWMDHIIKYNFVDYEPIDNIASDSNDDSMQQHNYSYLEPLYKNDLTYIDSYSIRAY
jgi:hypothetical protein